LRDLLVKSALNDVIGCGNFRLAFLPGVLKRFPTFYTAAYVDPLCMRAEQMAYFLRLQAGARFSIEPSGEWPDDTYGRKVQSGGEMRITCHNVRYVGNSSLRDTVEKYQIGLLDLEFTLDL
jgi:hypothetical protein